MINSNGAIYFLFPHWEEKCLQWNRTQALSDDLNLLLTWIQLHRLEDQLENISSRYLEVRTTTKTQQIETFITDKNYNLKSLNTIGTITRFCIFSFLFRWLVVFDLKLCSKFSCFNCSIATIIGIRSIRMVLNNLLSFIFATCLVVKESENILDRRYILLTISKRTIEQSSKFKIKNRSVEFRCAQLCILHFHQFCMTNFSVGYLMAFRRKLYLCCSCKAHVIFFKRESLSH